MSKIIINQAATFVSDAGDIVTTLNGLSDVTITSVSNNQVLKYDSGINRWVNGTDSTISAINDLTDVTITSVADGEILVYDGANNVWINSTIAASITSIDDLGDVNIAAATNGDLLVYNSATSEWQNVGGYATETYVDNAINNLVDSAPGALDTLNELAAALGDDANFSTTVTNALATKLEDITGEPINDLSDVVITSPVIGNYLRYNGTNWTNQTGVTNLNSLTDVNLSGSIPAGSMLFYGGTQWTSTEFLKIITGAVPQVNTTVPLFYTSSSIAGQIGFFNTDTTPATGGLGSFSWRGYNTNGISDPVETFALINVTSTDLTPGSEDGNMEFRVINNGTLETHFKIDPNNVYGTKQYLGLENSSNNQEIYMENTSAHGATTISAFTAYGRDSASAGQLYTSIQNQVLDDTAGSEDASIVFNTVQNGTLTESFRVGPSNRLSTPTFQTNYFQIDKGNEEPILYLVRTGTTNDGNRIGAVEFYNKNDADEFGRQVTLDAYAVDVTDGTEDGQLIVSVTANGNANSQRLQIHPDKVSILNAPLKLPIYTVATLPAGESGMIVSVSDSNHEPHYYDGSNWLNLYDVDGGTY